MKLTHRFLLCTLFLVGLPCLFTGCYTDGYVGVNNGVYYGPHRDPWFRDDPWMDGHRWYRGSGPESTIGIYIHPPRRRR